METKIRRGELIMNTGNIVRVSVEVDYYLSQICKRYKECTGNRLTKQDALLKLISRDAFITSRCLSTEAKTFFNI